MGIRMESCFSVTRNLSVWLGISLWLAVMPVSSLAGGPESGESLVRGIATMSTEKDQELVDRVRTRGQLRVIVRMAIPYAPEGELSSGQVLDQRARIEATQDQVIASLRQRGETIFDESVRRFRFVPGMALTVSESMLELLQEHPLVLSVVEDRLDSVLLYDTVPLTGTDTAWSAGYSGSGQVVAVLDTGVNKNHPFLAGKVVAEACFSTSEPSFPSSSLCPGGASSSTASNSGLDCTGAAGCGHGTHVAGIAAGLNGLSDQGLISGVGRDAGVIAIQVFSQFSGSICTNFGDTSPCVLTFTSDQIAGLEHLYSLRNSFSIASANMSLGGGEYNSYCDDDERKPIVDQLRAVGIATVIASGNNGYFDAIGAPACISTAVSVGSSTKLDSQSSFNNTAAILDLMAPGSNICSSVNSGAGCGSGFAEWNGTSMAAPHVSGAWAALKSAKPDATVAEILQALQHTGTSVSTEAGMKPRINVDLAIVELGAEEPLTPSQLFNISTRGAVGTGDAVLIGGFVIRGDAPREVLIRARGPSLPSSVPGRLADPMVTVYSGQTVIASNDNWGDSQQAEILATGRAPAHDSESAILITLDPGPYTAIVTGIGGTTGIGIVEILDIALDNP